jgi:hypothetical protein
MQGSLLLQLLILLVVANGTAVGAKKLLGAAFARPLDGGEVRDSLLMVPALRPEAQGRRALRTALTS